MLPSWKKSSSRLNLGFVATELAILVVLLIGLATSSVLVQQTQNPEKKAQQRLTVSACLVCNANNNCVSSNNIPCDDLLNECTYSSDCQQTPVPPPPTGYTCNGNCIPEGENCWRSGTGSCQSNFFCCKQQDPDPTATPFYTPTRAPTRTPTQVPTRTPTPACGTSGSTCQTNSNCCSNLGLICTYGICRKPSPTPSVKPSNTPTKAPTRTPSPTPYTGCYDSDGGRNYFRKGYVRDKDGIHTDKCPLEGDSELYEYICNNGIWWDVHYTCPGECRNGACLSTTQTPTPACVSTPGGSCTTLPCCSDLRCTYGFCRRPTLTPTRGPTRTPTKVPTRTPTPASCSNSGGTCIPQSMDCSQTLPVGCQTGYKCCAYGPTRTPTPACISSPGGSCTTRPCCSDLRCTYGFCRRPTLTPTKVPSITPTPTLFCYDSDGRNHYKRGYIRSNGNANGANTETLYDYCRGDVAVALIEYICSNYGYNEEPVYYFSYRYDCPYQCYDGACINPTITPTITPSPTIVCQAGQRKCWSQGTSFSGCPPTTGQGNALYVCIGGSWSCNTCGNNLCQNGRCVSPTPTVQLCKPNTFRCQGATSTGRLLCKTNELGECNSSGSGYSCQACPAGYSCPVNSTTCISPTPTPKTSTLCLPFSTKCAGVDKNGKQWCDDGDIGICSADGSKYNCDICSSGYFCKSGNNQCTKVCEPDSRKCIVPKCGANSYARCTNPVNGSNWVCESCPIGYYCSGQGSCVRQTNPLSTGSSGTFNYILRIFGLSR